MKSPANLRRSSRVANNNKGKQERVVIDLLTPSPKRYSRPKKPEERRRERPRRSADGRRRSNARSLDEMGRELDEAADELYNTLQRLSRGETVDVRRAEELVRKVKDAAKELKSGEPECSDGSRTDCGDESSCASGEDSVYDSEDDWSEDEYSRAGEGQFRSADGDPSSSFDGNCPSEANSSCSFDGNCPSEAKSSGAGGATERREAGDSGCDRTKTESFDGSRPNGDAASEPNLGSSASPSSPAKSSSGPQPNSNEKVQSETVPKPNFGSAETVPKPNFGSAGSSSTAKSPPAFHKDAKENVHPNCNSKRFHGEPKKGFGSSPFFGTTNAVPPDRTREKCAGEEPAAAVERVLLAHRSGRGSHYRVLGLPTNATGAGVRKAYMKQSLRIHPDKNGAPGADEAFRAANAAYEVLRSPGRRAAYDRDAVGTGVPRCSKASDRWAWMPPGSNPYNTIPTGARVSYNGLRGTVTSVPTREGVYSVRMDAGYLLAITPPYVFQNVEVALRDWAFLTIGTRSVTTVSYWEEQGTYRVGCIRDGKAAYFGIRPLDFVIPRGTVVRLGGLGQRPEYNGSYGAVVRWSERIEDDRLDTSFYEVQLSPADVVCVKMANVYL